jgi:hypothetical protein
MDAEPPERHRDGGRRPRTRLALRLAAAGLVLGLAAAMSSTVGDMSFRQTLPLSLPAAVLVVGGLAAAAADAEPGERRLFRAGFTVGRLVTWWRSLTGRRRGDRP